MNTDKIIAESIAKDYAPKESSKLVALKKLDNKAKLPATIFTYSCGIISALVFGTGMCLAMQVIGSGIGGMILGILVGIIGLIGCGVNYPIYKKYLEKWMDICNKRQENRITVAIGDIDHFKKINDTYGHDCGDLVLVTVSDIFKKHMKDNGCTARWGGEEFLLVFEKELEVASGQLCEMLNEIKNYEFDYKGQKFHVTLTVGVNGDIIGRSFDEIVNNADECLYKGKTGGRDRVVFTNGKVIEL